MDSRPFTLETIWIPVRKKTAFSPWKVWSPCNIPPHFGTYMSTHKKKGASHLWCWWPCLVYFQGPREWRREVRLRPRELRSWLATPLEVTVQSSTSQQVEQSTAVAQMCISILALGTVQHLNLPNDRPKIQTEVARTDCPALQIIRLEKMSVKKNRLKERSARNCVRALTEPRSNAVRIKKISRKPPIPWNQLALVDSWRMVPILGGTGARLLEMNPYNRTMAAKQRDRSYRVQPKEQNKWPI